MSALDMNTGHRTLRSVAAADIQVRPIKWLWEKRLGLGTFALLGGRESVGKSTFAYDLAAQVTRGTLPGVFFGQPKGVMVVATEDPWEQVIVPRLMAADADLNRVYRVDVITSENTEASLSLPSDIAALAHQVTNLDVALIILDPLLSRLDATLDTHRDAEARRALEPVAALADKTNCVVLGLIHVNKSQTTDPLTMLMASRAFTAVARAVLFMMVDPEDESLRLLGQPKNNFGSTVDLPTLQFTIEGARVAETGEGPVWASHIVWTGQTDRSIRELIAAIGEDADYRTEMDEAVEWLGDYLRSLGGCADSADLKRDGNRAGISTDALKRARHKLHASSTSYGFPRKTRWCLASSGSIPGESPPTALTAPTAPTGVPMGAVSAVGAVSATPRASAPTELHHLNLSVPWPEEEGR